MKDFCNVAEKDCIRLIVAQDLKESGIDVDANNFSNLTCINTSQNSNFFNNSATNHHHHRHYHHNQNRHNNSTISHLSHHHHLATNNNLLNTSAMNPKSGTSTTSSNDPSQLDSKQSRLFGVELRRVEMVNLTVNEQLLTVPLFLKYAFDYINEFIHIEGIFRRNGTTSRHKELKKQVEEGTYNFSQFAIFDLTSLVKTFFREMPESLLTFSLYTNFIQAVKLETTKSKLESILNLCLQLPDLNLHLLIYLMNFLKQITVHESLNKMNSFNLAVCFAPNIIYTRINKVNDLYLNEERIVIQLLIENSSLIGKISDSVYERSLMLNSLCSSSINNTTASNNNIINNNSANTNTSNNNNGSNSNVSSVADSKSSGLNNDNNSSSNLNSQKTSSTFITSSITSNNDLIFLYDDNLQENSSFAHHGQSAGSTSLSSYCGSSSSNNKKEKKKRRSSSLKELMNTIQNSISKFRRRSASEKNDKTTCSIITCNSMTAGSNCGTSIGDTSCSSRIAFDDKKSLHNHDCLMNSIVTTPFIGSGGALTTGMSKQSASSHTPICASLYATPRINKRNAEDSLQSTTKKKLMEKLPQRNLLLPNAPITPFSTTKKSKHPFKNILTTSETTASTITGSASVSGNLCSQASSTQPTSSSSKPPTSATPLTIQKQQVLTTMNANPAAVKQLKYEESPSVIINQTCDIGQIKQATKYQYSMEKNLSLNTGATDLIHHSSDCKRRIDPSSSSSSSSSKHHHHHHHHHSGERHKGSSSSHYHHHHHHHSSSSSSSKSSQSSSQKQHHHYHHQYVNAMPSIRSGTSRYINQSDLCTQIISGSCYKSENDNRSSSSSNSSSSSACSSVSSSENKSNNPNKNRPVISTSLCTTNTDQQKDSTCLLGMTAHTTNADNSMRCTLRRGRPNTPKTGLSVEYRIRKSSVPNTPECKNIPACNKINYTISNDDIKIHSSHECKPLDTGRGNKVLQNLSTTSLNTAMVQVDDEDKISIRTTNSVNNLNRNDIDDLNDARLLDIGFNGDEEEIEDQDEVNEDENNEVFADDDNINDRQIDDENEIDEGSSSPSSSGSSSSEFSHHLSPNQKQISVSLTNLPSNTNNCIQNELVNTTSVSENICMIYKSEDKKEDTKDTQSIADEEMPQSPVNPKTNSFIEEQQKLLKPFEPFEFKLPSAELLNSDLMDKEESENSNMLQSVLRRQSLFKLKEKINGKVSRQINEIEQRKLSPYRFSNSPLKLRKFKESSSSFINSGIADGKITKSKNNNHISPLRVPSIFCKKILSETPQDNYIIKPTRSNLSTTISTSTNTSEHPRIPIGENASPLIVRAANQFYKRLNRNRSVKRLNATIGCSSGSSSSTQFQSQLPSIMETEPTKSESKAAKQLGNSPTGKHLILSTELKCSSESIDL